MTTSKETCEKKVAYLDMGSAARAARRHYRVFGMKIERPYVCNHCRLVHLTTVKEPELQKEFEEGWWRKKLKIKKRKPRKLK